MNSLISFNWYLLFIILGIFQALFLGVMIYLKGRTSGSRFRYLSLFMISLALVLAEVFLDYSGYIMKVITIDKFSFPIQFLIAPSLYLFIRASLHPSGNSKTWIHFLPFLIILMYFSIYYLQGQLFKYNLHIEEYGLDLQKIAPDTQVNFDPLQLHRFIHYLVFAHLLFYAYLIWRLIARSYREASVKVFNKAGSYLNQYRNLFFFYLLALLFMAYLLLKYFWLGDFVFSLYLTCIIYLISINMSYRSLNNYFRNRQAEKYASSNLDRAEKESILEKIQLVIEQEEFFCRGNASLDELSARIKVSRHHISQVINELSGKSFFEYLAELRIAKARALLADPMFHNITIDEISFMVGYNSRSAFNRVFKSIAGTTPAEFRRENS